MALDQDLIMDNTQSTINIAVCDDDESVLIEVREYLAQFFCSNFDFGTRVLCCRSGDELLGSKYSPDIVFLDIEMQGTSGIETAKRLKAASENCIVIFMTSHTSYVSDSFRVGAFQFLVKPIAQSEFDIDLSRALDAYKKIHDSVFVTSAGEKISLRYSEIFYIESMRRKLILHTDAGSFEYYESLKNVIQKFNMYNFYQTHKSFIVNMDKIRIIKKDKIVLINGNEVFLSKNFRSEFITTYTQYMERRAI